MIVQPQDLKFTDKKFSMIISGTPGIGKTTLALSAPSPILIDFDRGVSRVNARHRTLTDVVETYDELLKDIQTPAFRQAETVVIDTGGSFVTYLQDWAMNKAPENKQKNGGISLKGYGAVKAEFVRFTNQLKDIMNKNIVYVFHTTEEKDRDGTLVQRLLCEGAARNIVWQPCDLGCYMFMAGNTRKLGFSPTETYFGKGCYGIEGVMDVPTLDDTIPNNFITRLFDRARQNIADEADYFEAERVKYDAVMQEGAELIATITDAETCVKALEAMKGLEEVLTSRTELNAAFKARLGELGLKWNKEKKRYE